MILPDKTITLQYSLVGTGYIVLNELRTPKTLTELWENLKSLEEINNYKKFILTLDFLYMFELIEYKDPFLVRCNDDKINKM